MDVSSFSHINLVNCVVISEFTGVAAAGIHTCVKLQRSTAQEPLTGSPLHVLCPNPFFCQDVTLQQQHEALRPMTHAICMCKCCTHNTATYISYMCCICVCDHSLIHSVCFHWHRAPFLICQPLFYSGHRALPCPGSSAGQCSTKPTVLVTHILIMFIKCGVGTDDMM